MLTAVADEANLVAHNDADLFGRGAEARESEIEWLTRVRQPMRSGLRRAHDVDVGIPLVDDRMRLPSFAGTCPHVCDNIIPLNGGRFNVDHYLRVVRARAEIDTSFAMALTVL